jgi:cytochrome oxidase Cu insertion factor (SCO1/SenC/PrrC family)
MPGMGDGINIHNPFVADAFYRSLQRHGLVALIIAVAIAAWLAWRTGDDVADVAESRSRRILRYGFGLLWILDGVLQMQSAMPLGLATNLLTDARDATPTWMQGPVNASITLWNEHPVGMATVAVLIELGIGILLLSRTTSAWAARVSLIWVILVWVASGYGGLLSPESSFFFGWPGSPLYYFFAGLVLRRRDGYFPRRIAGRASRWLAGSFILGALVQLRPGTGAWQSGSGNAFWQMAHEMSAMPQPEWIRQIVRGIGHAAKFLGPTWNLAMVLVLVATGLVIAGSSTRTRTRALVVVISVCSMIWIGFQDLGLFGGLSTDPNSMPTLIVIALAWWAAHSERTEAHTSPRVPTAVQRGFSRSVVAMGIAVTMTGAFALVSTASGSVETTLQIAANGEGTQVVTPAPPFVLRDQNGQRVDVPSSEHRIVVLTFLDPVCYEECSTIGHQLVGLLRTYSKSTPLDVVAVAANTADHRPDQVRHFLRVNGFDHTARFYFVSGSTRALEAVYASYGVAVQSGGEDGMSIHTNVVYVIDGYGQLRYVMTDTPAPGQAGVSSATAVLRGVVDGLLSER